MSLTASSREQAVEIAATFGRSVENTLGSLQKGILLENILLNICLRLVCRFANYNNPMGVVIVGPAGNQR